MDSSASVLIVNREGHHCKHKQQHNTTSTSGNRIEHCKLAIPRSKTPVGFTPWLYCAKDKPGSSMKCSSSSEPEFVINMKCNKMNHYHTLDYMYHY